MSDLYLGRTVSDGKPLHYDSRDLVTHGVCVGMTGSGKTGLCIDLLEEALLAKVPLFIIDPKGDVTNLLLLFPDLRPEDFAPWVDPPGDGTAQAKLWRDGLAKWNVEPASIRDLKEKTTWRLFTPGSRVVRPVNLLGSLDGPPRADEETLRDGVRGLVSGLLGLAGVEADLVSDPRAILLSRIVEREWKAEHPLDLTRLVAFVKNPQLDRVGAVSLDEFLPRDKRQELALALNNLLASPDFESWREGDPLDPEELLRNGGGAACNLFYIAHLDDRERMFFVSRFLDRLWSWTRTQSGTSELRAILYFDEVMGFLPPVAEPPSKRPLLSLLKQGRAFGVGSLLVTQNPVDLDYKALTNAGTWMVGRLQAERDKDRLLDGLESAGIGMSRGEADKTISGLEKRKFLLHDVHRSGGPVLFETRWARAFLRGPLALRELTNLRKVVSLEEPVVGPGAERDVKPIARETGPGAPVPPSLDGIFQHRYLASRGGELSGEVVALVEARVNRQRPPVSGVRRTLVRFGSGAAPIPVLDQPDALGKIADAAPAGSSYGPLPSWATKANAASSLERIARDAVSGEGFDLENVAALGIVRNPDETSEAFEARVRDAIESEIRKQTAKVRGPLSRKLESLQRRIDDETRELERDRAESARSKTYSAIDVGASILTSVLGGRRGSLGTAGRAGARAYGRIQRSAENVKESEKKIADWTSERDSLAAELEKAVASERERLQSEAARRDRVRIPVNRADVRPLEWYVLWS